MKTPAIPFTAIRKLVEYLADEESHYNCNYLDDDDRPISEGRDHIFHSVRRVARWLDRVKQN
jgi:hypothetical protein